MKTVLAIMLLVLLFTVGVASNEITKKKIREYDKRLADFEREFYGKLPEDKLFLVGATNNEFLIAETFPNRLHTLEFCFRSPMYRDKVREDTLQSNMIQIVNKDKNCKEIYLNGQRLNRVLEIQRKLVSGEMEVVTITFECEKVNEVTATQKDVEPLPLSKLMELLEDGWVLYDTEPTTNTPNIKLLTLAKGD